jgi:HEAT repeat protein
MTVAAAAIAALGDVGSRAARDVLVKLCSAQESPRRELAGQALISVADRLVNEGHGAQAPRLYELVYRAAESTPLRAAALRGLAYTDPHQAMPRLIEASGGSDPALCRLAVRLLGEVPGPSAAEDLVRLLPTLAPDLQVVALAALAERGAGKTAVIAALASDDVRVRSAALEALQTLGGAGDVVTLATAAARASGSERDMARHSLARLRGPDVDDAILTSLPAAEPGPRSELIRALAARQCRRALPTLYEEAKQADETVRVAALGALGELSPPADAPALVLLLLATDGEASRAAAEDAVVAVCNRIEDVPARARPVLVRWNGASPAARCSLLRVLGRIGGPAALECIRAARQSDDADLVDAAVRALAKWASADVLDDLLDIARNSESKTHRVLTLEGFIRLLGLPSGREPQATAALYETALSLAERPEEKKAVLSGISSVPHVDALRLAQRCLADEEVRAEAESAVLGTARLVGPWQLDPAEAAVESILAKTTSDDTRERGTKTLEAIRKAQGCILTWSLTGPYFSEGQKWADVLDTAFAPEQPETSAVAWRPLKSTNTYQPWIFDLTQVDSGSDRCVYVQSHIWSPQSQDARLDVGSDDAVRVWLNGQRVHEFRGVRAHEPLQDQITVHLESGWNTLTLKVVQAGGGWGFSAALRTPDGQPLTGLRIQAEAP